MFVQVDKKYDLAYIAHKTEMIKVTTHSTGLIYFVSAGEDRFLLCRFRTDGYFAQEEES